MVVVVNVTVAEGTRAVGFVFTELEEQQQDGVVVDMGRYRNASHIFVEVRRLGVGGGGWLGGENIGRLHRYGCCKFS